MLNTDSLSEIFMDARTSYAWTDEDVTEEQLMQIFDLAKMGPTSANCSPMRIKFIRTPEAKEKLKLALGEMNVEKTISAPVTAILAYDFDFYQHLPELFPHTDAKAWFEGNQALIDETTVRNGTLQAGYFIIAARALGLDCGPMSGFDRAKADELFFAGTNIKSNFLCNLGHADKSAEMNQFPRAPRFEFSQVCEVL